MIDNRAGPLALVLLGAALSLACRAYADEVTGAPVPRALPIAMPQVHGRVYIDGQTYNGTATTVSEGLSVDSARLSLSGKLPRDWTYLLEYDFARKQIKYAWMRYDGFAPIRVKAGQYKAPFSLEELTSTRFITFIERGLPNTLAPGYHVGVGAERSSGPWTAALGVFSRPTGGYAAATPGNGSWAVTGRLTWDPVNRTGALLHLGASGSYRLAGDARTFHVHEGPESGRTETYYLDTEPVTGVDHFATLGVEGAATAGPWSAQAEYIGTDVSRRGSEPSVNLDGAYGFVSWFPTGESRHYGAGRFRRIHPLHGPGALQLALRYSFLDLNSGPVAGGRERDVTLGVNWYFSPYMRFMFNYIKVHARTANGTQTPNIFLARLQGDF